MLKLGTLSAKLADARGLVALEARLHDDLRPIKFGVILALAEVDLVPGEETPVTVAVEDLPRNADVKAVEATLTVSAATTSPPPETTAVTVTTGTGPAAPAQAFSVAVSPKPLPSNVQVRLDGGDVFWTHDGTLEAGAHPLGDFAAAVNRYLDEAALPEGPTSLTFLVKSDTPGRAAIEVDAATLRFTVLQTQTWPNPLDGSVRIDRNLELDFGTVVRIPLDGLAAGSRRPLPRAGVRLDLSGDAGPERLLGDVPAHDGRQFATVSPDYAVAQAIEVASGAGSGLGFQAGGVVRVAGVAAIVEVDADAELYLEVQRDVNGAPSGEAPLGGVDFALAPPEDGPRVAWAYAALGTPVEIPVDARHWVVLRGIRGTARLAIADGDGSAYLGGLLVNRGGQLWKPLVRGAVPGPAALVRVAYLPEPDNDTTPVAVGFEGASAERPDVTAQPQRLTLAAAGGTAAGAIVVTSHARGTLALANVVQEFAQEDSR